MASMGMNNGQGARWLSADALRPVFRFDHGAEATRSLQPAGQQSESGRRRRTRAVEQRRLAPSSMRAWVQAMVGFFVRGSSGSANRAARLVRPLKVKRLRAHFVHVIHIASAHRRAAGSVRAGFLVSAGARVRRQRGEWQTKVRSAASAAVTAKAHAW